MPNPRLKPLHWMAMLIAAGMLVLAAWWWLRPSAADQADASTSPVADAQGGLKLTDQQIQALGIETIPAKEALSVPVTGLPAEATSPLAASSQVTVPFAGVVTRVLVDEGEQVRKGQPLLRVQSRELIGMRGDLARARSDAGLAVQQARRDATLAREGIIASARRDESAARAAGAKVTLDEANALLSQLRPVPGGLPGEYDILAPRAGLVLRRSAMPGDAMEAMSPAFVIADSTALDIRFSVPIALRTQLRPGLAVTLPDGAQAEVLSIGADTDAATQVLRVRAHLDAPGALVAGQQFEVALQLPAPSGAVIVPVSALQPHGQRESLYVLDGNTYRGMVVERLGGDADTVVVRGESLRAGLRVVSKGGSVLKSLAPIVE